MKYFPCYFFIKMVSLVFYCLSYFGNLNAKQPQHRHMANTHLFVSDLKKEK